MASFTVIIAICLLHTISDVNSELVCKPETPAARLQVAFVFDKSGDFTGRSFYGNFSNLAKRLTRALDEEWPGSEYAISLFVDWPDRAKPTDQSKRRNAKGGIGNNNLIGGIVEGVVDGVGQGIGVVEGVVDGVVGGVGGVIGGIFGREGKENEEEEVQGPGDLNDNDVEGRADPLRPTDKDCCHIYQKFTTNAKVIAAKTRNIPGITGGGSESSISCVLFTAAYTDLGWVRKERDPQGHRVHKVIVFVTNEDNTEYLMEPKRGNSRFRSYKRNPATGTGQDTCDTSLPPEKPYTVVTQTLRKWSMSVIGVFLKTPAFPTVKERYEEIFSYIKGVPYTSFYFNEAHAEHIVKDLKKSIKVNLHCVEVPDQPPPPPPPSPSPPAEVCSKEDPHPRLQIAFVFDKTGDFTKRSFYSNFSRLTNKITTELNKEFSNTEFAITLFADWPDETRPGGYGKQEPSGRNDDSDIEGRAGDNRPNATDCCHVYQRFTADTRLIAKKTREIPGITGHTAESSIACVLFTAAFENLGWIRTERDPSGKKVHRIIVFVTNQDSTEFLGKPGRRQPPLGLGTDTCAKSLPPTKPYTVVQKTLQKWSMSVIGIFIEFEKAFKAPEKRYQEIFSHIKGVPYTSFKFDESNAERIVQDLKKSIEKNLNCDEKPETDPPSSVTEPPSSVTEPPSSVTEPPSSVTEPPSSVTEPPSSETEDVCAPEDPPAKLQVAFVFDKTGDFTSRSFYVHFANLTSRLTDHLSKEFVEAEYAVTLFADWPHGTDPKGTAVRPKNPGPGDEQGVSVGGRRVLTKPGEKDCCHNYLEFTTDRKLLEKRIREIPGIYGGTSEASLACVLYTAASKTLGWKRKKVANNGGKVYRVIVFFTNEDTTEILGKPGNRKESQGLGEDTCPTSLPPKKPYKVVADTLTKLDISVIGILEETDVFKNVLQRYKDIFSNMKGVRYSGYDFHEEDKDKIVEDIKMGIRANLKCPLVTVPAPPPPATPPPSPPPVIRPPSPPPPIVLPLIDPDPPAYNTLGY